MKYVVGFSASNILPGIGGRQGYMSGLYSEVKDITRAKKFEDINFAHMMCHQCQMDYPTYLHWVEEIE